MVLAAAVQGLAPGFGAAMAQQTAKRKASTTKKARTIRAGPGGRARQRRARPGPRRAPLAGPDRRDPRRRSAGGDRRRRHPQDRLAEPMRVTDQIHIGSCTKAMTATLIGMLVDEGSCRGDRPSARSSPTRPSRSIPTIQRVTLSQLLTHRAGLPPNVSWWHLPGRTLTEQRLSILVTTLRTPPRHRPGTTYEYSNVGYALAGLMAETVADRSWESPDEGTALRPARDGLGGIRLARPARHRRSALGPSCRSGEGPSRPSRTTCPAIGPGGHRALLDPDWSRFAALHLAAARGKPRLLKAATFRAPAHAPDRLRLRRRLGRLPAHLGRRPGLHPQRQQHCRGTRRSGWPRPSTSPSSPRLTRATRWPRRPNDEAIVALIRAQRIPRETAGELPG